MISLSKTHLENRLISPGNIFWIKKNGKDVLLIRSGDFIDHSKMEKYFSDENFNLRIELIASQANEDEIINLLYKLKNKVPGQHPEVSLLKARKNILYFLAKSVWTGVEDYSGIDFINAGIKVFLDKKYINIIKNADEEIAKRSLLIATYSTLMALTLGYKNFTFLKELYHATLMMDCSLMCDQIDSRLLDDLELEREVAGKGQDRINNNPIKKARFTDHAINSYTLIAKQYSEDFSYPSVLKLIQIHHERINGTGFPNKLCGQELSDLEVLTVFLSNSISYKNITFSLGDASRSWNYFFDIKEGKDSLITNRVEEILKAELIKASEEGVYLEVAS